MHLLDLLDALDAAEITLSIGPRHTIATRGPRAGIKALAPAITEHRDLLLAHLVGVATGHVLAFCDTCREPTITARHRGTWPPCRATPGCGGANQHGTPKARHLPRPADLERRANAPRPPKAAQPPPHTARKRLFGPWPAFPSLDPRDHR